ncbi:sigma-70 family RNA polymerase sigma factor [Anaerosinus massiliensis]|uniref:sigma-70 family RNA polymerase sigma factor n=1 Tax=Massilibacillus massiliensis TaxID=1806837 RepID=UPI000DA61300|nr:sigma-70 family RNA polymerase sigma factor [Massilibacillus massiliensis]
MKEFFDLEDEKEQILIEPLFRTLNKEEEYDLLHRWCKNKDDSARSKLFICNRALVVMVAKKIYNSTAKNYIYRSSCLIQLEDLIQEGYKGLHDAIERFSLEKKCRFSTYAVPNIRKHIYQYITDNYSAICGPYMTRRIMEYNAARNKLEKILGRAPKINELAIELNCTLKFMSKTVSAANMSESIIDIDGLIKTDEAGTKTALFASWDPTPEELILENETKIEQQKKIDKLPEALKVLSKEERIVICMKFGIGCNSDYTRTAIGKRIGITRFNLCILEDLEKTALNKLKQFYDSKKH